MVRNDLQSDLVSVDVLVKKEPTGANLVSGNSLLVACPILSIAVMRFCAPSGERVSWASRLRNGDLLGRPRSATGDTSTRRTAFAPAPTLADMSKSYLLIEISFHDMMSILEIEERCRQ